MSSGCGDVLSLEDLKTAKKHQLFEAEVITGLQGGVAGGTPIDYATNQVTGQTQKTLPAVLRDAGFRPASFTFATGGTLGVNDADLAVLWPGPSGDGQYYVWRGALPKTIPASSSPSTTGGISDTAWVPFGDISLRNDLAASGGADIIGKSGGGTVQDGLDDLNADVSVIESKLADTGKTTSIARVSNANYALRLLTRAQRVVNKSVPQPDTTKTYDHFGTMSIKADGTLWQVYRRGYAHTDKGSTMYTELLPTGAWKTPVAIITDPTLDIRGTACGTAPDGVMYTFGTKATATAQPPASTTQVFSDTVVYKSVDNGATWSLISTYPKPDVGDNALFQTFGKMVAVGNKLIVPAYGRDNSFVSYLSCLQSTDNGVTWVRGPNIASGSDYNEASILDVGGGVVVCVARTGSGTVGASDANNLRQFISADGGVTWSNQGYVTAADSANDLAWQLITPALSLVYSDGGTPYVLLTYTRRRDAVKYRTCTVAAITAGVAGWSLARTAINLMSPESFESGYQTQEIVDNVVLMNVYYTTVTSGSATDPQPVSNARQFQMPLGELPDFESAWTATTALTNWTVNHGLACIPKKVILTYCPDNLGLNEYPTDNVLYYNGTTTVGGGVAWQCNLSGFTIRPGTYLTLQSFFGTGGTNPTTGYIKVRAWK